MTKPIAVVGYIGSNTNLTFASSLVATELAAMGRILERCGYDAYIAHNPFERKRPRKEPKTGIRSWDGKGEVDVVWIHQGTPNFMGGPTDEHCDQIGILGDALVTAKQVWRLLVDNNESMRHRSVYGLRRNEACPGFLHCAEGIEKAVAENRWSEVGWAECQDPDVDLPFKDSGITAEQLLLTRELLGGPLEKEYDFCYVGTSRANPKKRDARETAMGGFLQHEPSFYTGSFFKKRKAFVGCWEGMARSRAHLIVRDATMRHKPLHRYLQALILDAVPIVLNEPTPAHFIHDEVLQNVLRVSSYEEGLELVKRREELLPRLRDELQYWLDYDLARLPV